MLSSSFKYSLLLSLLTFMQVVTLLVYLNANIINVGGRGVALPVLVSYFIFSGLLFFIVWMQKQLFVRFHFFLFLMLITWIAFRVIVDLGDMEYLKQISIATTGGMLLFYVMGAFLGISYQILVMKGKKSWLTKLVVFVFLCLLLWMAYKFMPRIRSDIFYLEGVNGNYQRSGNFLSISFVVVSFFYLQYTLNRIVMKVGCLNSFFWFSVYTISTFIALVGSQLFGSNSATAVVLGVYLITIVMTLVVPSKVLWLSYIKNTLVLPWSKKLILRLAFIALAGLMSFLLFLTLVIILTGFDITSLRLLGFGSGTNTSLLNRIEILLETGAQQMGYAPFFGNINVAYLTTGDAGRTLHSFFPYVMANLGLFGMTLILVIFISVIFQLYGEIKARNTEIYLCYQQGMIAIYSFFIFLFLVFFANIATGVSWAVLWFALGFMSKPFGFKI